MMKIKAQVSILSIILITGIVLAMVGTAYLWGAPQVEKRSVLIEFTSAVEFIQELDNRIIDIANTGTGEYTLKIPSGGIKIIPNEYADYDNNSIIMELFSTQPMILNASDVYLGGSLSDVLNETGVYGTAEPSVTSLRSETLGSGYKLSIKLHYRELDSGTKGYKIILNQDKGIRSGNSEVTISFTSTETITNGADSGGDLVLTHINIDVA